MELESVVMSGPGSFRGMGATGLQQIGLSEKKNPPSFDSGFFKFGSSPLLEPGTYRLPVLPMFVDVRRHGMSVRHCIANAIQSVHENRDPTFHPR
jgi:hypothetical protein